MKSAGLMSWPAADLKQRPDEELIPLFQCSQSSLALDELLGRYYDTACRLVGYLCHEHRVGRGLTRDAKDEVMRWLLDAIGLYRVNSIGPTCTFRTFLVRLLLWRLLKFLFRRRRVQRRYHPTIRAERRFEFTIALHARATGRRSAAALGIRDTAELADLREQVDTVGRLLCSLDERQRAVADARFGGVLTALIAQKLGVSVSTVERDWRKIVLKLRELLAGEGREYSVQKPGGRL